MAGQEPSLAADKSSMFATITTFPQQIREAVTIARTVERLPFLKVDNVIVCGMGASGISGDILQCLLRDRLEVPLFVNRDPDLPKWANKDTLVMCLSYSGNTEETVNAFKAASQRKCKIVCVTTGGKLADLAEKREVLVLRIPSGMQPRAATAYLFFPSLLILEKAGLIKGSLSADIDEAITATEAFVAANGPSSPEESNPCKQLARKLHGSIPQIYGWGIYAPIARRMRSQINENSKLIARDDIVPEANHNDIVGWSADPEVSKLFTCVLFRDRDEESLTMQARLGFMKSLFGNVANDVVEVTPTGKGRLAKVMTLMCTGDFTSVYLALHRGVDPTPVDIITDLKQRIAER